MEGAEVLKKLTDEFHEFVKRPVPGSEGQGSGEVLASWCTDLLRLITRTLSALLDPPDEGAEPHGDSEAGGAALPLA